MESKQSKCPEVSVVIPTYNGQEFLKQSIESVLNQTFSNFELIVCDDGSTDQTVHILEEYEHSHKKISVFKFSENVGLAGNWNRCLEKSRGTYIKMLCQDDIIKPTYLEETVKILNNHPSVSLVCSFEQTIGEISRIREQEVFPGSEELDGKFVQKQILQRGNWIGPPTATLFRSEHLEKIGFFDKEFPCGLDWEMWLRLAGLGNVHVIPTILYSSRIHPNQETSNCNQNLGFMKDRVSILNKLQNKPELYGRKSWNISQEIYLKSVYHL